MTKPLAGIRVVVTRDAARAGDFAAPLAAMGAEVVRVALVQIEPLDQSAVDAALDLLVPGELLVFTSATAVRLADESAARLPARRDAMRRARVCAVGRATAAALHDAGIPVGLVPDEATAEGLLGALAADGRALRGAAVLYLAAEGARDVLPDGIRAAGARLRLVHAYRTVADEEGIAALAARLAAGDADVATVAAPSAARALARVPGALQLPVVAIGPVTVAAARAAGFREVLMAHEASAEGLVQAVVAWAARHRA